MDVQEVINTYRELTGDNEFLRLAWMREDAKREEATALHHAREAERKKWQAVVAEQAEGGYGFRPYRRGYLWVIICLLASQFAEPRVDRQRRVHRY